VSARRRCRRRNVTRYSLPHIKSAHRTASGTGSSPRNELPGPIRSSSIARRIVTQDHAAPSSTP
jgi:hypothetical protein